MSNITFQELYNIQRQNNNPTESAKSVIDIMTTGTWAVWDTDKIDRLVDKVVEKYEPFYQNHGQGF